MTHTPTPYVVAECGPHNKTGEHFIIHYHDNKNPKIVARGLSEEDAEFIVKVCNAHNDLTAQFQAYSIALDRAKRVCSKNKSRMSTLWIFEEFYIEELVKAKSVNDKDA